MNIPPIPKSRKPEFPDPDERISQIELRQTLHKVLFEFRNTLPSRKRALADLIVAFSARLLPQDLSNLPYISTNGKARNSNKDECMMALISWTIQQGWAYQRSESNKVEEGIEKIKEIAKVGLNSCSIVGDAKGYELELEVR